MPLMEASGNVTADAYAGGVAVVPKYIEDYFSTFLYAGNGANRSINNGIDLSTKGGMVWFKARNVGSNHYQVDTARGNTKYLASNSTTSQMTFNDALTAFTTTGFNLGVDAAAGDINGSGYEMASWSIAKAPKFFDVVTYTGDGTTTRFIPHSLNGQCKAYVIKATSTTGDWWFYHADAGGDLKLNSTEARAAGGNAVVQGANTTNFIVNGVANTNGVTYVAYLFAHNAGGFGLTGTDNVISCGSFTTDGSGNATVNLGWEPQWILVKRSNAVNDWFIVDNMRGLDQTNNYFLRPNLNDAEFNNSFAYYKINATGFDVSIIQGSGNTVVYIAIRRGPMKVPTDATKVFAPVAQAGGGIITTNFPVDLSINRNRGATGASWMDRLRGGSATSYNYLLSTSTAAESTGSGAGLGFDNNTGYVDNGWWSSGQSVIYENFRRAPSTFDEVCYTGNDTAPMNVAHNLGVTPELMIIKKRNSAEDWNVFNTKISDAYGGTGRLFLNKTDAYASTGWSAPIATSTAITLDTSYFLNQSGSTYVAYLWATNAGVTKVGTYTGNGSSQTINCGFTGGARFVMIKATSTTGNWLVADSARGIVSGNDPALYLNSTSAEVTGFDWIDADNSGFIVNETSTIAANTNGVQYLFLAYA